jgi:dihydrofolate reductase
MRKLTFAMNLSVDGYIAAPGDDLGWSVPSDELFQWWSDRRTGLIDEYAIVTHPVLVGGGTPFFPTLDDWVNLDLVETRTFPDGVLLTRYETRR